MPSPRRFAPANGRRPVDNEKAVPEPAAEEARKKVAVVLSQFPESRVTIEGYTDAKGGKTVNLPLSREFSIQRRSHRAFSFAFPSAISVANFSLPR